MSIPPPAVATRTIVFELCAETLQACLAAREGGASRIELCAALDQDGLTPQLTLVRQAVKQTGLPIHPMLRPRPGNFLYTDAEFATMQRDLASLHELGVTGVVLGLLRPDGRVDIDRTAQLVAATAPLQVTFHRAFDQLPDLPQGLEDVIATGCHRVLTSGGAPDVVAGTSMLARLVRQAAGRIDIALGGGLRPHNAAALARATGATHFHGSLQRVTAGNRHVDPDDIRSVLRELREA